MIGVVSSISTPKSTAKAILGELGAKIIDADPRQWLWSTQKSVVPVWLETECSNLLSMLDD